MDVSEAKNKILINKIAKKNFGLNKKSQKLFTERLLYNRPIAKEWEGLFKHSNDLRVRFTLTDEDKKLIDDSWKQFSFSFSEYITENKVEYKQYLKGKITRDKNEKKISKDIKDFYIKKLLEAIKNNHDASFYIEGIASLVIIDSMKNLAIKALEDVRTLHFQNGFEKVISLTNFFNSPEDIFSLTVKIFYYSKVEEIKTLSDIIPLDENFEKIKELTLENIINKIKEQVDSKYSYVTRTKSITSEDMELVFTLNYADWFLCSTGESWGSCISLDSDYEECYWTGLPSLIGDKSRGMVYITKKGSKKNVLGIKVDKFLKRSWIILSRAKSNNKTFINILKAYPNNNEGVYTLIEKYLKIPSYRTISNMYFEGGSFKYVGRCYAENLWFRKNTFGKETFTTIYMDDGSYKIANKNKTKYFPGDYGYHYSSSGGLAKRYGKNSDGYINSLSEDEFIRSQITFRNVIENEEDIVSAMNYSFDEHEYEEDEGEDW